MGIKTTEGLVIESGDYVTIRTKSCGEETVEVRYVVDTIAWDDEQDGNGQHDQVIVCDPADVGVEERAVETIDVGDVIGAYLREDQARVAAGEVAS